MKISLIEDEPDCFEPYESLLKTRQHDVNTYTEADDAVENIEEISKSDIVLLDLMIQLGKFIKPEEAKETGIAIYKRIRELAPGLRIVVITARLKQDIWSAFEGDTNVRFLSKPVNDLDVFYSTIENWSK